MWQCLLFLVSIAMAEAAKRNLERKPEGSNPESPDKQRARTEDETPAWAKKMLAKMDGMESKFDGMDAKVDGMAATVDGTVKAATEAKESVKKVEAAVEALQGDMGNLKVEIEKEKKERSAWWIKKKESGGGQGSSSTAEAAIQAKIQSIESTEQNNKRELTKTEIRKWYSVDSKVVQPRRT